MLMPWRRAKLYKKYGQIVVCIIINLEKEKNYYEDKQGFSIYKYTFFSSILFNLQNPPEKEKTMSIEINIYIIWFSL